MPLYSATGDVSGVEITPHLYFLQTGATDFTEITLPVGTAGTRLRPSFQSYRRRIYIQGLFSPSIVIDEHRNPWRVGIHAPLAAPSVAASGTGLTGTYIPYLTFVQKDSEGKTIHESNLSAAGATLTLSNQGRSWTSLPTTSMDPRVTHKRGYVSIGGAAPRLVWERELGTVTTVTESVSDTIVANNTATPVDTDGETVLHARGVPPPARFGHVWRDRLWLVGDPGDTVYFSKLFEPESFRVDEDNRFNYIDTLRTKGGESIIGIRGFEDALVLYCVGAEYAIVGYGPTSFEMRKISSSTTCLSHHAIVDAYGHHLYPTATGTGTRVTPSDGAFRNLMRRTYADQWQTDYATYPRQFENSQAAFDQQGGNYILLTENTGTNKTFSYVIPYDEVVEEGVTDPPILFDIQARRTTCIGVYSQGGAKQPTIVYGDEDGYIRKEDATDADDDGDTYNKALTIRPKHFWLGGDQGGDDNHGGVVAFISEFVKSPNQNFTINGYAGDDDAASGDPQFSKTVQSLDQVAARTDKTSHRVSVDRLSGKGVTVEVTASAPVDFEYRGFNLEYLPGGQSRNQSS